MKCINPETSNGKKCDGEMTAPDWIEAGKVECEKCGYRTNAKVKAEKPVVTTSDKENK